ncbi:zinc transporter ZIP1 [Bombina bombina]|uniref:zinc transporter ZIP1 n=1 Tax=Bombina bombina TaxID=8345 RepID=UPI00235B0BCE|nr:zinc transporter ZIP1 [Bombina bombina]
MKQQQEGSIERLVSQDLAADMAQSPDSEKLVWSPGLDVTPLSVAALELKLGSVITLLLLTFISGLAPLFIFRRPGSTDSSGKHHRILSLVSCFSSGVFLATCLLDLVPNYLSGINDALQRLNIVLQFPLQEFILSMGLFLFLALEQIVQSYKDSSSSSEDTHALLGSSKDGHVGPSFSHSSQWRQDSPHIHVDINSHSAMRCMILVLSLSLHAVLEGLKVGQQQESSKVLEMCFALLLHKCILSFSMTLKLGQGHLKPRAVLCCLLFFSFMLPLGIGLGLVQTAIVDPVYQLAHSVISGMVTGTFVYITFMEILPHDLGSSKQRIPKVIVQLCGFSVITGILFMKM